MKNTLQNKVNSLAKELSEEEFYSKVNGAWGLVPSEARQYLVGLHEYSVAFGVVVENPFANTERTTVRRRRS